MSWASRAFAASVLLVPLVVAATQARAETIWEKAKNPSLLRSSRLQASVERTLQGTGDALDQLATRTALIELARSRVPPAPAVAVLLLRFRRQLGMQASPRSRSLLAPGLAPSKPRLVRALAELESAHVLLEEGRLAESEVALDRALTFAWHPEVRGEVLLLRGWERVMGGRLASAEWDFAGVLELEPGLRRQATALLSLACLKEAQGDPEQARSLLARGKAIESSRAQASGVPVYFGLGLTAEMIAQLEGLESRLKQAGPAAGEQDLETLPTKNAD